MCRAGAHRVVWSRSVRILIIFPNSVMGRTNPYVSKEQEFAFFRLSFDAGTCSSLDQNFSGPCTNICHVYHPSNWTLPIQLMQCSLSCSIFVCFQDLRPIFHWNTKQLFLYLSAEYNNTQGVCSHLPRFNLRSPGKRLSHSTHPPQ